MRKRIRFCIAAALVALIGFAPRGEEALSSGSGASAASDSLPAVVRPADRAAPPLALPARPTLARAPEVPPLPYRFAGKSKQGSTELVFLAKGDTVIAVKEGDTLEGDYRVVSITPLHIELVYLPLGKTDRIAVISTLEARPSPAAVAAVPAVQKTR